MADKQLDEERIFHVARGLDDAELLREYLNQVCAGDQALRERVEELLAVHERDQSFLKSQAPYSPTILCSSITESVGQQIGRYKLLQKIGEGGFGVVYMAEQVRPVRRKVALKVIKPGMDTAAVVARFEAERQALALMDHPNIARVFDGGATESGRPYFVMELVKGISITEFCDENKFTIRERLGLFTTVCRAIQHAHQKGVIHRDIKPSNVLVTLHDGAPVPKVIDFGVSKAIAQQLTEKTLFTSHGQMIGTPQYMSPEQAEMSGLDIDTRSDIYSLGILLYELLTGVTPLDPATMRGTAYLELQRMIREGEPMHPSRRCSTQGEQSALIAAKRRTNPQTLGVQLRGEVDWIVMKSLEKDRNRRYDSATALAEDVRRFLDGEIVGACPPSAAYRLQKFARKHKSFLLTGGFVAVILLVASIVSLRFAVQSNRTADRLKQTLDDLQKARTYEQQTAINRAVLSAAIGNISQAREAVTSAKLDNPNAYLEMIAGQQARFNGRTLDGVKHLKQALELAENDVVLQAMLADAYLDSGAYTTYSEMEVARGRVTATNDLERMFVGHALYWSDPAQSRVLLDEAVENLRHPLAYIYRARTLSSIANATDDVELMESAIQDVDHANAFLSDNAYSRHIQLIVQVYAHDLFMKILGDPSAECVKLAREMNLETRAVEVLEEAGKAAAQSEKDRESFELSLGIGLYYLARGETEKAESRFEKTSLGRGQVFTYAMHPSRTQEEVARVLTVLDQPPIANERSIISRCVLLLDQGRVEEVDHIVENFQSNAVQDDSSWIVDLLLLTGRIAETRKLAVSLLERLPPDAKGMRAEFLRFHAGLISEEEYINRVPFFGKGGAYLHIGEYWLVRGEHVRARENFRLARRLSLPPGTARAYSEAFLTKMDAEEDAGRVWPSWIPPDE